MFVKRIGRRGIPFRQEVMVLYFGCRDPRTPLYAKLPALCSLIYLISPIDLIPDFIPVAGYIDDLVIVPLLLHVAFRLLPKDVREESRIKSIRYAKRVQIAMAIGGMLLLLLLGGIFIALRRML